MTSRLEDLKVELAELEQRKEHPRLNDPPAERIAYLKAEIEAEEKATAEAEAQARRTETVRLKERLAEVETATKAAAPERAVSRTTAKRSAAKKKG